jgi:hypothetical protein
MWVKKAAIRPVPRYAQLPAEVIEQVEVWLGGADDATPVGREETSEHRLNDVFERFEREQPALAQRIGDRLTRTADEVALALGYFLCLSLWLAFDRHFGSRISLVTDTAIESVNQALRLDEHLRGEDPTEVVDSDEVVAMEQPHVLDFVTEHIDAALEVHANEVDVDAVHATYRLVLVEVLALSYAIQPPDGMANMTDEILA